MHETLSQAHEEFVDFDEVADRLRVMVSEVSSRGDQRDARPGGQLRDADRRGRPPPLAMVLTEILQNAVEHGFGSGAGTITVTARRIVGRLHVTVDDDGVGLPADFDVDASASLGLSIVRTLVESELGGQLEIGTRAGQGTHRSRSTSRWTSGAPDSGGADPGPGVAALERAALVLAQPAPDTVVLSGLERPGEALLAHVAATAHLLGLLDLEDGRTGVADREEQLRVLVEASRTMAPIHGG